MQRQQAIYAPSSYRLPPSLAQVFRPTAGYRDLVYNSGKDAVLYDQEINVLLEISLLTLNCLPYVPTRGIMILDGQKRGEEAQLILRAPLRRSTGNCSSSYAEQTIDYVLESDDPCFRDWWHSGIFSAKIPDNLITNVLVLNTTAGRFIATIFCEDIPMTLDFDYEEMVLLAIATAIGCMGVEDAVLQDSLRQMKDSYRNETDCKRPLGIMQEIERLFKHIDNPVIRNWYNWHEPANQSGKLELFFE